MVLCVGFFVKEAQTEKKDINPPAHLKLCHRSGARTEHHMHINPVNECQTTFMTA